MANSADPDQLAPGSTLFAKAGYMLPLAQGIWDKQLVEKDKNCFKLRNKFK